MVRLPRHPRRVTARGRATPAACRQKSVRRARSHPLPPGSWTRRDDLGELQIMLLEIAVLAHFASTVREIAAAVRRNALVHRTDWRGMVKALPVPRPTAFWAAGANRAASDRCRLHNPKIIAPASDAGSWRRPLFKETTNSTSVKIGCTAGKRQQVRRRPLHQQGLQEEKGKSVGSLPIARMVGVSCGRRNTIRRTGESLPWTLKWTNVVRRAMGHWT